MTPREPGLPKSHVHVSRRRAIKFGAGMAGLLAFGPSYLPVAAQEATPAAGPAQLFNPSETPPSAPSGELRHALVFDPLNLDSTATYTVSNAHWEGAVYSPLTWRDPNLVLYDGLDGRPTPDKGFGLASSWEYVDDKTLKMSLKTGITFHDGEPFTADSVKTHFTRMLDPKAASPQAFNYATIIRLRSSTIRT